MYFDRCECTQDGYTGRFCQICETCKTQCAQMRPCVECLAFGNSELLINPQSGENLKQEIKTNCSQSCPFIYDEDVLNK
jgi:hypothetical protein